ncbi:MAG: SDR family NAD(P)-dependent oxidoreductase [Azospirillaceae bacterium]|nr:SDR family NAD(P)-dependent oxidoreductase [Azospirillaceae bacterium]
MIDLAGKHIVITGAAGALGAAVADRALELGARPILVDFKTFPASVEERQVTVDLTDAAATRDALAGIGAIDALFHIAGGFDMGPAVYETTPNLFARMMTINVATLQNAVTAVVPTMLARGRGKIVTVGALSAVKGLPRMGAYCAAKSAVMRLTESLSGELRDNGINVNGVLPSLIDTPANRRDMPDADFSRWVSPRQLADVICFLGSDAAAAVHGALIPVTGRV